MIKILSPGKVFLDYGPLTMVIAAWAKGTPLTQKCVDACRIAVHNLQEISRNLPDLKKTWALCAEKKLTGPALEMWQAAKISGDADLTPLAAVAGIMADGVADWLVENGADKVIVNNGGDIALRLGENEHTNVGLVPSLGSTKFSSTVVVKSSDNIGGIATSGLGGRSFTKGIADSVTVFAKSCVIADVFATSLANASYINSPDVRQVPAETIDPNTDIPGQWVTIDVGQLNSSEIKRGLEQIKVKAEMVIKTDIIKGVVAHIQGEKLEITENLLR